MFRKTLLMISAGLLSSSLPLMAQQPPESSTEKGNEEKAADEKPKTSEIAGTARFWQATLNGGSFMVALDQISSVSRHQYVLDAAVIVDEVTVDTLGQVLTRFYYITPITEGAPGNVVSQTAARGRELADRGAKALGTDLQNMVVKTYPSTTHARSVEYRILSERDLTALYESIRTAWESGRGRKFLVK
jgi:hypothetical protein